MEIVIVFFIVVVHQSCASYNMISEDKDMKNYEITEQYELHTLTECVMKCRNHKTCTLISVGGSLQDPTKKCILLQDKFKSLNSTGKADDPNTTTENSKEDSASKKAFPESEMALKSIWEIPDNKTLMSQKFSPTMISGWSNWAESGCQIIDRKCRNIKTRECNQTATKSQRICCSGPRKMIELCEMKFCPAQLIQVPGTVGCYKTCGDRGGYCPDVCGEHGLCCRREGYNDCPLEFSKVGPLDHHACIELKTAQPILVPGTIDCFETCGNRGGYCPDVCGKHALCCRKGFNDCPLEFSEVSPRDNHTCIEMMTPMSDGRYPVITNTTTDCLFKVLSVDHAHGNKGTYFHFYRRSIKGLNVYGNLRLVVKNLRTGEVGMVKVWGNRTAGTKGDANGRFDGEPVTMGIGQWQVGDWVQIREEEFCNAVPAKNVACVMKSGKAVGVNALTFNAKGKHCIDVCIQKKVDGEKSFNGVQIRLNLESYGCWCARELTNFKSVSDPVQSCFLV